jgi:hypothetical protein
MSDARYYVVGDHDVWMVKDGDYGPCVSRDETVVFAVDAAQKLGMRGECAHVCVVDDDGRLRPKWTYDRDHHLRRSVIGFGDASARRSRSRLGMRRRQHVAR